MALGSDSISHLVILVTYLITAVTTFITLSKLEALLLVFLLAIMGHKLFGEFRLRHLARLLKHDQEFSRHTELIYKATLPDRYIRLLRLLPGRPKDEIKCELLEAELDKDMDYEAISYVWGTPKERKPITCEGQRAYITTSLAQILYHLRDEQKPRLLWADGICINQRDVIEKGHQVQHMGEVFAKATRVLVWLGPDTKDHNVERAMRTIDYINDYVPIPDSPSTDLTLSTLDEHMQEQGILSAWNNLQHLFDRQWWQRIWCVQETILSRSTLLICGDAEIDGSLLGHFTRWHHKQRWLGDFTPPSFNQKGVFSAYRRMNKWGWTGHFLEVIDTFRGLEATDSRDKIYALLGLVQLNKNTDLKISVDYHKSLPEVLYDAIKQSVHSEGDLHFLSYVDQRNGLDLHNSIPTWIPRWDLTDEPWHDQLWCSSSSLSASKTPSLTTPIPILYAPKLSLKGTQINTILRTTDVLYPTETDNLGWSLETFIRRYLSDALRPPADALDIGKKLKRLATTLTAGYLGIDGWVENRAYLEQLDHSAGRQYLVDFYAMLATKFPEKLLPNEVVEVGKEESIPERFQRLVETYSGGRSTLR